MGKNLWWQKVIEPEKATLNLTNATVDAVMDDKKSWPDQGRLYLDGFVYGRFPDPDGPNTAGERLKWLRLVEPFTPQPYSQLAKVFRDEGHEYAAKEVLIEMEDRRRRENNLRLTRVWRWIASVWAWILWATVGYGHRPLRAFWCLLVLTLAGWGIYGAGEMVPTEEKALQSFKDTNGRSSENYPPFFPLVYSLENSVPLIKLGQVDRWQPNPSSQAPVQRNQNWGSRLQSFVTNGRFLMYFRWGQIMVGWLLATLFVAGLTGIVRRM